MPTGVNDYSQAYLSYGRGVGKFTHPVPSLEKEGRNEAAVGAPLLSGEPKSDITASHNVMASLPQMPEH